jgi:hypothetical protein
MSEPQPRQRECWSTTEPRAVVVVYPEGRELRVVITSPAELPYLITAVLTRLDREAS